MDQMSFPAAIVASWIIVALAVWGHGLAKKEINSGVEPKGATAFVFVFCGIGVFFLWTDALNSPFIQNLGSDLIGALIGLGSAYFALHFLGALRLALSQWLKPRQ